MNKLLTITWYDNAAFRIYTGEYVIWFDPSINKNPGSPIRTCHIRERAHFVFTTHGHPGHFVNSIEVAQITKAKLVAVEDLTDFVLKQKLLPNEQVISLKFEEIKEIDKLKVYLFEVPHPDLPLSLRQEMDKWSYVASPNTGFVIEGNGYCLCFMGDCLYCEKFIDIGNKFQIDLGMIPIQGKSHTNSSPGEAAENGALIARDLKLKFLFPVIQYPRELIRVDALKRKLDEIKLPIKIIIAQPGTVHRICI